MSNFKYVDLGLSSGTLWANENLPGYYAFGELEEKLSYTQDNSITFDKNKIQLMKEGLCDSSGNAISKHSYTIPTKEQFLELMTECDWKWDSNNYGYKIRSKKYNDEDHEIFLPTEGYKLKTDIVDKGVWGNYWTASIIEGKYHAAYLYFFKNAIYWGNHSERFYGRSVRPVLNTKCTTPLDLGLSSKTLWDPCEFGADSPIKIGKRVAFGEDKEKPIYDVTTWKFSVYDILSDDPKIKYLRYRSNISLGTLKEEFLEVLFKNSEGNYKRIFINKGEEATPEPGYSIVETIERPKGVNEEGYWIDNPTDLIEPSIEDYKEMLKAVEDTDIISINGAYFKIFYFENREVLLFRTLPYYWTKDTYVDQSLENKAYVFDASSINVNSIRDLGEGHYLKRIKKQ